MKVAVRIIILLFSLLLLTACLGGIKESKEDLALCQQSANVAGLWRSTEKNTTDCPTSLSIQNSYSITQKDCKLTIKDENHGAIFGGIIKNNIVSVTGSFPEVMGIVTFKDSLLTLNADGNTMNGYSTWVYHGGSECSGKTDYLMIRVNK